MSPPADLVLLAGRVLGHRGATAVAVRAGRIAAVGHAGDVRATTHAATEFLDVPGGLVCPGLQDAHFHLVMTAERRVEVDLRGRSRAEILAAVTRSAGASAPGRWIVGGGYDPGVIEGAFPRHLLDGAAPAHPVLLRSHDHHSCLLNTRALEACGLLSPPPTFPEGSMGLRPDGEPDGVLREAAALAAEARAGERTDAERAEAVRDLLPDLFATGLTAVHDMSGSRHLDVLRTLDEAGRLPLDVVATLAPLDVMGDVTGDGARLPGRTAGGRLEIRGVKAFLDGALGSRTAHLLAPYEPVGGEAEHLGIAVLGEEETRAVVRAAAAAGLPSWLHAIGDAAVRRALDALRGVTAPDGSPLRHRVEHAQMIHPDDLPRFAAEGVVASVQPSHLLVDAPLVRRHWGSRSSEAFPLRRLLDSGATVAFGSDSPIESFDPLAGIRAAVHRRGQDGSLFHPEEAVTVAEALEACSAGAARAAGLEHETGTVSVGGRASLTVLDRDPRDGPEELAACAVSATIVRGEVVFAGERR